MSRLDRLYRQLIVTGFFKKGWGDPSHIKELLQLRQSLGDPTSAYALQITNSLLKDVKIEIEKERKQDGIVFLDASFSSPFHTLLPHMMPPECRQAKFQLMYNEQTSTPLSPLALHLAGTGDHHYYRRRILQGNSLLKEYGVNSVFVENPFYGYRKPKDQLRSSVHYVSDIFIMGAALILESWVILNWITQNKIGSQFCLTGVSMGGFMASLAAGFWRRSPVALVPCLSWSSAAPVYTDGVLADALPWKSLLAQYLSAPVFQELQQCISRGEYGAKYINGGCLPNSVSSDNVAEDLAFSLNSQILKESLNSIPQILPPYVAQGSTAPNSPTSQRKFSTSSAATDSFSSTTWRGKSKRSPSSTESKTDKDFAIAKRFMENLMDQFTHLGNYSAPLDTNLTQFLVATLDMYVPSHANDAFLSRRRRNEARVSPATDDMRTVWPGCSTIELKDYGHVGAYLFKQKEYSKAIKDSLVRLQSIYHTLS